MVMHARVYMLLYNHSDCVDTMNSYMIQIRTIDGISLAVSGQQHPILSPVASRIAQYYSNCNRIVCIGVCQ